MQLPSQRASEHEAGTPGPVFATATEAQAAVATEVAPLQPSGLEVVADALATAYQEAAAPATADAVPADADVDAAAHAADNGTSALGLKIMPAPTPSREELAVKADAEVTVALETPVPTPGHGEAAVEADAEGTATSVE